MNVIVIAILGFAVFALASRFYGGWVARKVGVDPDNPTPAQQIDDGRDYVPTRISVVFAHHFSSIAGAGPIVGPTLAAIYGFMPAVMWVVLGGIFIGAVHDFTALFASMREGGKSMAEIARKSMGRAGFTLFLLFTIVMIVLITAVFLKLTAKALASLWPLEKLGLDGAQTLLRTEVQDGVAMGHIGGIASTSVIVVTALAPVLGYLLYRRGIRTGVAYLLGAGLCAGSILVGLSHPLAISPETWMVIISVYVLFAAGAPVWVILQPRDFINSQILYGGMALMFFALLSGGFGGLSVTFPAFNFSEGIEQLGLIWPMMFVTIACGAISGFHCLVSSGTTSKQCSSERDAKRIGFDGMLLECVLALFVLLAIGSALGFEDYKIVVWNESNPVLGFALAAGKLANTGLGIHPGGAGHGVRHPDAGGVPGDHPRLGGAPQPLPVRGAVGPAVREAAGVHEEVLVQRRAGGGADVDHRRVERRHRDLAGVRQQQPAAGGARPDRRQHLAAEPRHPAVVHADSGGVHDGDHPVLAGAADAEARPRGELPAGRRRGRALRARPGGHRNRHPDPCRRRPEARDGLSGT